MSNDTARFAPRWGRGPGDSAPERRVEVGEGALEVVERLFAPRTFEVVLGQKDGVPHKPDPSGPLSILRALEVAPAHALFVGDSETDVRTAKNAGLRAVAVTWGLRDRQDLEASAPDHLVDHPREILALLTS